MVAPGAQSLKLSGTVVVAALLASAACGRANPSSPSPAAHVTPFAGAWHGDYRVATCTGGRNCFALVGTDRSFVLALTQSGADVSGVFTSDGAVVDVQGRVDADDQLRLEAAPPSVESDGSAFTKFEATLTVSDAELRGTLEFTIGAPFFGSLPSGPYTRGGVIRSATRGALTPVTSYTGAWRGKYIVRTCTPVGWPECHWAEPGERYPFEMTLTQSGNAVAGTVVLSSKAIPVQGDVRSSGLTLGGDATTAISGGTNTMRLVNLAARRDAVGRLSGRFRIVDETAGLSPAPMSMDYDAELLGVVMVQ